MRRGRKILRILKRYVWCNNDNLFLRRREEYIGNRIHKD